MPTKQVALEELRDYLNQHILLAKQIADRHVQRGTGGRELCLAIVNLQQSRQWVDEALSEIEKAKQS